MSSTETKYFKFPESALAHKYCKGKGLEIGGSAHNPFGLDALNVDITDSLETFSKQSELRFCGETRKIDIVASGDKIPLPDESQDFIVSSHVIEHFPNPIKVLMEWDRLVRPGGIIFIIVPHKDRNDEKDKPISTLQEVIAQFNKGSAACLDGAKEHWHCWRTTDFVEIISYMIDELGMKWRILKICDVDDKVGNGFTVIIRKKHTETE